MQKLIVKKRAREFINKQTSYYRHKAKSPKTAKAFRKEIIRIFRHIQQNPLGYQASSYNEHIRIYPENKYHHYIFYQIIDDTIIVQDMRAQAQSNEL